MEKPCCKCEFPGQARYSLGIYAGRYCDAHWATSGYRKDGPEGFDPAYAGESYDPEPYYGSEDDVWYGDL